MIATTAVVLVANFILFIVDDEPLFRYLKTGDSMDLIGQRIADLPLVLYTGALCVTEAVC